MSAGTILDEIVAHKKLEVGELKRSTPLSELQALVDHVPASREFAAALRQRQPAVIAELKKASPSKGVIREAFDVKSIASSYEQHGASCLSVLTDERYFQGSSAALRIARSETNLPVLRKDFVVDEYQIFETKVLPADCLLLIVSALDQPQLQAFHDLAKALELDVLVEIHDEDELDRALQINPELIGINNRNLKTFVTDLAVTEQLAAKVPSGIQVVSESGIHKREDVTRVRGCGVNAFLVGEAFMREPDPGLAMKSIFFDASSAVDTADTTHAS